jgi:RNA-directed DNA polymerase
MKEDQKHNVLNIQSLKHLALQLHISKEDIVNVVDTIGDHFCCQPKEIIKNDGTIKVRNIYHPSAKLKTILKAIDVHLLRKIELPREMHGARKSHSNVTNAKEHLGRKHVSNYDIKNYFPTISPDKVYKLFTTLKCSPDVARCLARLCTADNHVPQGYNTSPRIANLVATPMVKRIAGLGNKQGLRVTTFVDDITISGNKDIAPFEKTIQKIVCDCGFEIKKEKTNHLSAREQQTVTGVIVNKKANISKQSYNDLRFHLTICKKYGPSKLLARGISGGKGELITDKDKLKKHLLGKISYLKSINPERWGTLLKMFKDINWQDNAELFRKAT